MKNSSAFLRLLLLLVLSAPVLAIECGAPGWSRHNDAGVILWQSCDTQRWEVRVTAGGLDSAVTYEGAVAAELAFIEGINTVNQESADLFVTSDPQKIDFSLKTSSPWYDGFNFRLATGTTGCFSVDWNRAGMPTIFTGPDRLPVTSPFDLETLGPCQDGPVRIGVSDVTVSEADTGAQFSVTLTAASNEQVTVAVATADGTAQAGSDYETVASTLVFAPGETVQTVVVPLLQDSLSEGTEQFSLLLSQAVNAVLTNTDAEATIQDDEINICGEPVWSRENDTGVLLWQDCITGEWQVRIASAALADLVTFNGSVMTDLPLTHAVAINQESSDTFDQSDPLQLVFGLLNRAPWWDGFRFGVTTGSLSCFEIAAASPGGGAVLVGPERTPVTSPFDLETLGPCQDGPVRIGVSDVTVSEADTGAQFSVTLTAASNEQVTVAVATADGTAQAGSDYETVASTLVFAPGETVQTVVVPLLQDSLSEGTEQFSLLLSQAVNAVLTNTDAEATIQDDEINICGEPVWSRENDTGVLLWQDCITGEWQVRIASAALAGLVTFNGSVMTDLPLTHAVAINQESSDTFDQSDPLQLVFGLLNRAPWWDGFRFGVTTGSLSCFEIAAASPGGGAVLVGPERTPVTSPFDLETLGPCQDGPVRIGVSDVTVSEADTGAQFSVTLTAASNEQVTVAVATADGTAQSGSDYETVASTLVFAPGETVQTVVVPLLQDDEAENPEIFSLLLNNAGNAVIETDTAVAKIMDDEISPCGAPDWNITINEGVFVWRDCSPGGHWHLRYRHTTGTNPGSVTGKVLSDSGFVNILAVDLEATDQLVNSIADNIEFIFYNDGLSLGGFDFETSEGARICLDINGESILLGASELSVISPFGLDSFSACHVLGFSDVTVSVSEAASVAILTVTLSSEATETVAVDYQTIQGTAQADTDYLTTEDTLVFFPGITSQALTIPLLQDEDNENTETFSIMLNNASNAFLATDTGVVSVIDDEISACGQPDHETASGHGIFVWQDCETEDQWHVRVLSDDDSSNVVFAGALISGAALSNVEPIDLESADILNNDNPAAVEFSFHTHDRTEDGFDFTAAAGTGLCLDVREPVDTVLLLGANRNQAASPLELQALTGCRILRLETLATEVNEESGLASFQVTLSAAANDEVTVEYTTIDGTATAGTDYTEATGTLTFETGETHKSIEVPILTDAETEATESFGLQLSNANNALLLNTGGTADISDIAAYPYYYLDDANIFVPVPEPLYPHDLAAQTFPRIGIFETNSLNGDAVAYSKYHVISSQGFSISDAASVQSQFPDVAYFRHIPPVDYQNYDLSFTKGGIGKGPAFEKTTAATGDLDGKGVFAGHWLYLEGGKTRSYISTTAKNIKVDKPGRFKPGTYAVIYNTPAGSFQNAEHVRIISKSGDTLTVQRGYKSSPVVHPRGSIIAQHDVGQCGDSRCWAFNQSIQCPRDANGYTMGEYMADWLEVNYKKDQHGFEQDIRVDGIVFDVDYYFPYHKPMDADNDLTRDKGISPSGVNWWGTGMQAFYSLLRERFPDLYIVGGMPDSRADIGLNGIQIEGGFMTNGAFEVYPDYSRLNEYFNSYRFWMAGSRYAPAASHVLLKAPTATYNHTVKNGYVSIPVEVGNRVLRFSLGMTLMDDGYFSSMNSRQQADRWYDEFSVDIEHQSATYGHAVSSSPLDHQMARQHRGWLGLPLAAYRRIYSQTEFHPVQNLAGEGHFENGISDWNASNVSISHVNEAMDGNHALYASTMNNYKPNLYSASVTGPQVNLEEGSDYTLMFTAKASRIRDIKALLGPVGERFILGTDWRRYVMSFKAPANLQESIKFNVGREDSEIWLDSVLFFKANANLFRRDFDNGIVVVNATPDQRTIDLDGNFLRILGNQDPVNDGSSLTQVILDPYDAAILVRPDSE